MIFVRAKVKTSSEVLCPTEVAVLRRSAGSLVSFQTLGFFGDPPAPCVCTATGALLEGGPVPFQRRGGRAVACCQPFFPSHRALVVGRTVVTARTAGAPLGWPYCPSSVRSPVCVPHWHSSDGWSRTHGRGHHRATFSHQDQGKATALNAVLCTD